MKLKSEFITQELDDLQFLVPVGGQAFSGIVRSNGTAAFIVNCLKENTTPEEITDRMASRYDAPREVISADVENILSTLRSIGALEE